MRKTLIRLLGVALALAASSAAAEGVFARTISLEKLLPPRACTCLPPISQATPAPAVAP